MPAYRTDGPLRWSRRSLLGALSGGVLVAAGCGADRTPAQLPQTDSPRPSGSASAAAGPSASSASPIKPVRRIRATDWATGLTSPWGLHLLDDDSALVAERDTKRILLLSGGEVSTLTTVEEADPGGEGGLLGIRLNPAGDRLFVYYTSAEDNRVARFAWDGRRLTEPQVILSGIAKASNHDGGQLRFGRDGRLYVATGDAADRETAQDRESLNGKILRITEDGDPAPDNPFGNPVWSYGHRNVQGLAFDDADRLWATEFGQSTWDEVNLITGGANYGWPAVEGSESTIEGMVAPKAQWATDDASPSSLAYWRDALWMPGLRGERLWQIPVLDAGSDDPPVGEPVAHLTREYGRLRSVEVFPDGSGLLVGTSNTDGRGDPADADDRLLRVVPAE